MDEKDLRGVVARNIADLTPFDRNPRTHKEAQVAQIAASIKEFGFTSPVLIDEGGIIIAGHAKVQAAKKLGKDQVPCIVLSGLSATQKTACRIADNKLALKADWDTDMLLAELAKLSEQDFDFSLTGFSEVEIIELGIDLQELEKLIEAGILPSAEAPSSPPANTKNDKDDWSGMPEFDQPDNGPFRTIRIHFADQAAVDAFATLIAQNLTKKTKYVWFPKQVKKVATGEVYA